MIGDRLYVIGGWTLDGPRKGEWLDDSLVYDFADPSAGWQKLPKQIVPAPRAGGQPMARQARRARRHGRERRRSRGASICSIRQPANGREARICRAPAWRASACRPGIWATICTSPASTAACSSCADDGSNWEEVAKLASRGSSINWCRPRTADALLVVGGASRDGHLADVERIDVRADAAKKSAARSRASARPMRGSYTITLTPTTVSRYCRSFGVHFESAQIGNGAGIAARLISIAPVDVSNCAMPAPTQGLPACGR